MSEVETTEVPGRGSDPRLRAPVQTSDTARLVEPEPGHDARKARAVELEKIVGKTIAGRYTITRLIGVGGMGAVYEAEHSGIGKKVAIKFVDREHATNSVVASRFAREARAASAIESDHIVTVFDAGMDDERPYIIMELLRGEDLGQQLRREGKLGQREALRITGQVLRGLADAHEAGIVHRDLKPDNVFLVEKPNERFVKIVDFGISKIEHLGSGTAPLALTGKGTVLGTPFYMSPEQAQAFEDVDARTDLYSVGAMLFECLVGRPPHVGETYEQIIVSICMTDAPDLRVIDKSIPPAVARFVAKALARNRGVRFASARQMLVALAQLDAAGADPVREPMRSSDPMAKSGYDAGGGDASSSIDEPVAARTLGTPTLGVDSTRTGGANEAPHSSEVSWSSGSRPLVALPATSKRKGSMVLFIATGLAATLAGGLVTFGVATARQTARHPQPLPTATLTVAASAGPSASAATRTTGGDEADRPRLVVQPQVLPPTTTAASAPPTATSGTKPLGAKPHPKSPGGTKAASGGGLDLQRDFP